MNENDRSAAYNIDRPVEAELKRNQTLSYQLFCTAAIHEWFMVKHGGRTWQSQMDKDERAHLMTRVQMCAAINRVLPLLDPLPAYMLEKELEKDTPNLQSVGELLVAMKQDYGRKFIRNLRQASTYPELEGTAVEEMIALEAQKTAEQVKHQKDYPGLYEINYMYATLGNPELIRVKQPRVLAVTDPSHEAYPVLVSFVKYIYEVDPATQKLAGEIAGGGRDV